MNGLLALLDMLFNKSNSANTSNLEILSNDDPFLL